MNRLKQLREENNQNMRETAKQLGIPYTTYINYEKSLREPNSEMLIKLASFYGVSVDYLLCRTEERIDESVLDQVNSLDFDILKRSKGNLLKAIEEQENRDKKSINQAVRQVSKYWSLDEHGKRIVDLVLEEEYIRCTAIEEEQEEPMIEIMYSLVPASAGTGEFLDEENIEVREFPDTPDARRADIVIPVDGDSMEPVFSDGDELYVRLQPAVEIGEIGIFIINGKGYVKEYAKDRLISLNPEHDDIYPDEYAEPRCVGKVIGKVE